MQSINAKDPRERDHFAFGAGRRVCTLTSCRYLPEYRQANRNEKKVQVTMLLSVP
jgi:hypothetical protein